MEPKVRKIHECIKRTLIFSSGKKIKPVALCFANNFFLDSPCSGTTSASEEEHRENRELYGFFPNDSRCASCPFIKYGEYISDALRILKTFGLCCIQENSEVSEGRKRYFYSTCLDYFFQPLLDKVKSRCYLTFEESDRKYVINELHNMNFDKMLCLIGEMETFCKENNIK